METIRCPDCGAILEKRVVGRSHQRRTSIRYECPNPGCSVIFLEKRKEGEMKIVYDPTMEKKKSHPNIQFV